MKNTITPRRAVALLRNMLSTLATDQDNEFALAVGLAVKVLNEPGLLDKDESFTISPKELC